MTIRKWAILAAATLPLSACGDYIEPGQVGVKVTTSGGDRGIQRNLLEPGRHWLWWNERLYMFPTFVQNYVWSKDPTTQSPTDESIDFQSREGANINSDFGIQYSFDRNRIPDIFARYRMGATEITRQTMRNEVRDALVTAASPRRIEELIGEGKTEFMDAVLRQVRERMVPHGILVDNVYAVGRFRLAPETEAAINRRIAAAQETEQRRQQVETARAEAERQQIEAEAQARANRLIAESITPELVQFMAVQKWNGQLPAATSGMPFVNVPMQASP
jgi:regulator of protease activity HflC (stomatin/prohibitin superfamily)